MTQETLLLQVADWCSVKELAYLSATCKYHYTQEEIEKLFLMVLHIFVQ